MINIISSNGEIHYGVNEYIIDTNKELEKIPLSAAAGSTAYSIEDGKTYIKNNKNQWMEYQLNEVSGGGIINLPDNIIYSYDMTEEEFWDNYNNGLLNDGFYNYQVNEFDFQVNSSTVIDAMADYNPQYYKNLVVLHYNTENKIMCLDQNGNIINQTYFYKPNEYGSILDQEKTITDNGYLYLSHAVQSDSNAIFSLNLNTFETNEIFIENQEFTDNFNAAGWRFKFGQYNNNLNSLKTKLGGTFAFQYNDANFIYILDNAVIGFGTIGSEEEYNVLDATVNYDTNELYTLISEFNEDAYSFDIKLLIANSNCEYDTKNLFTDSLKPQDYVSHQLFFKNDILYGHYFTSTSLNCFLFDTITNEIIQLETIYFSEDERWGIDYYHNNIYKEENYAILTFNNELYSYLINIQYNDKYSYFTLNKISDFHFDNPISLTQNIINGHKYFSKEKSIYSLNLQNALINYIGAGSFNLEGTHSFINNNDLIAISYGLDTQNLLGIRINGNSGTITQIIDTPSPQRKGSGFEVQEKNNLFIYDGVVCDLTTLSPLYTIDNENYPVGRLKIELNDKTLWSSVNNNLGYFDFVDKNKFYIVNKNNILLTKQTYL